jgi:hypothetical protein
MANFKRYFWRGAQMVGVFWVAKAALVGVTAYVWPEVPPFDCLPPLGYDCVELSNFYLRATFKVVYVAAIMVAAIFLAWREIVDPVLTTRPATNKRPEGAALPEKPGAMPGSLSISD